MELRPYQKEDAQKLIKHKGSGCFNEQRTGKTPTALETLRLRNIIDQKVLVIATASSLYQWKEEYERWLNVPCVVCTGSPKRREQIITTEWTNGMIVSLDSMKTTARTKGIVQLILKQNPICVILDEAHRIKNTKTAAAKAVFQLNKIPYRLALTGTPAHGKAADIFSILKFLQPGFYNSEWSFKNTYFQPETKVIWKRSGPVTFVEYNKFRPGMERMLQQTLSEFTTQRKRKDVMPWLPDKDYTQIKLEPTTIQTRELKRLHSTFKVGQYETTGVLDSLIRERQLCLDPELVGVAGKSPKTEWIRQYLKDYPEKPVIIFSKSTLYLKKLYKILSENYKLAMIIGETPVKTDDEDNT